MAAAAEKSAIPSIANLATTEEDNKKLALIDKILSSSTVDEKTERTLRAQARSIMEKYLPLDLLGKLANEGAPPAKPAAKPAAQPRAPSKEDIEQKFLDFTNDGRSHVTQFYNFRPALEHYSFPVSSVVSVLAAMVDYNMTVELAAEDRKDTYGDIKKKIVALTEPGKSTDELYRYLSDNAHDVFFMCIDGEHSGVRFAEYLLRAVRLTQYVTKEDVVRDVVGSHASAKAQRASGGTPAETPAADSAAEQAPAEQAPAEQAPDEHEAAGDEISEARLKIEASLYTHFPKPAVTFRSKQDEPAEPISPEDRSRNTDRAFMHVMNSTGFVHGFSDLVCSGIRVPLESYSGKYSVAEDGKTVAFEAHVAANEDTLSKEQRDKLALSRFDFTPLQRSEPGVFVVMREQFVSSVHTHAPALAMKLLKRMFDKAKPAEWTESARETLSRRGMFQPAEAARFLELVDKYVAYMSTPVEDVHERELTFKSAVSSSVADFQLLNRAMRLAPHAAHVPGILVSISQNVHTMLLRGIAPPAIVAYVTISVILASPLSLNTANRHLAYVVALYYCLVLGGTMFLPDRQYHAAITRDLAAQTWHNDDPGVFACGVVHTELTRLLEIYMTMPLCHVTGTICTKDRYAPEPLARLSFVFRAGVAKEETADRLWEANKRHIVDNIDRARFPEDKFPADTLLAFSKPPVLPAAAADTKSFGIDKNHFKFDDRGVIAQK